MIAAVLAVAAMVLVALGSFVGVAVSAARARTAADAAALAGVTGGEPAAAAIAASHGGALVAWSTAGPLHARDVRVTVRVGRATATAAASNRAAGVAFGDTSTPASRRLHTDAAAPFAAAAATERPDPAAATAYTRLRGVDRGATRRRHVRARSQLRGRAAGRSGRWWVRADRASYRGHRRLR